ncbi:MAG: hypothetical protein OHK0010_14120 [Anaerolineales bacterium]
MGKPSTPWQETRWSGDFKRFKHEEMLQINKLIVTTCPFAQSLELAALRYKTVGEKWRSARFILPLAQASKLWGAT